MTALLGNRGGLRRGRTDQRILAFLVQWAVLAVAVWAAAEIVDGISYVGWESIALVSLVLGLLNLVARPVLVLLSLPITVLTLGLFLLVINAFLFWLAALIAGELDPVRFAINDFFWDAILGALIVTIVSWALHQVIR